ncbi:MAG TPA: hypothetical protein VL022_06905 [Moheibacter sp.]|nr:hypothetical protein [Moheibacter sp.]
MKKQSIYSLLAISLSALAFGQVAIGKENIEGNSTLLDFNNTTNNTLGIILPAVDVMPSDFTTANNGTFLFDKSSSTLKMYENNQWVNLSKEAGDGSAIVSNTTDDVGKGAIIGSETTNAQGVLVLESTDKAMILPRIKAPHLNVKSPYPGMMCYDTETQSVALFDGRFWNYWR